MGPENIVILASDSPLGGVFSYLTTASNWSRPDGILHRLVQHLAYSGETCSSRWRSPFRWAW